MAGDRKKSPVLFFIGAFIAIAVMVLVVNRKTGLAYEVRFPLNNGVAYLSTLEGNLSAVCHDGKVYVWNWGNLSVNPRVVDAESDQAVLLEPNLMVSIRQSNASKIVITELNDGKVHKEIPIAGQGRQARLAVNRRGRNLVVMLADSGKGGQEVLLIDYEAGFVNPIANLAEAAADKIMGLSVSDNGGLVMLAGEKNAKGYVVLISVEQKRIVWTKVLPDLQKVRNAVFSTDGKVIYIRCTDSSVQILNIEDGSVIKKLLALKENKSTAGDQNIQTLTVSADGRFIAASISSGVYVWDCKTEKLIFSKGPGHKLISGLTFSPDSKYLATSDTRQGGTIKIWRISKH